MEEANYKISKLLVEVCEELLPNTREDNNTKIKKILRKRAIKNVEERIVYQQKKVSAYTVQELRKLILSEEKKILQGAGWKGAIVAIGAMFGITNF